MRDPLTLETEETCAVVLLYEDHATRAHACAFCAYLERTYGREITFDFSFWKLNFLDDPDLARKAGQTLARGDIVVFSLYSTGELPPEVQSWFKYWLDQHKDRERLMVSLLDCSRPGNNGHPHAQRQQILYQESRSLRMDFLEASLGRSGPALPSFTPSPLRTCDPYRHWGINE